MSHIPKIAIGHVRRGLVFAAVNGSVFGDTSLKAGAVMGCGMAILAALVEGAEALAEIDLGDKTTSGDLVTEVAKTAI
jgi:hypothetical protein